MNRPAGIREAWFPQTAEERDAILRELQEIAASPHFCNSKRYPAFLRYIVENTLAGRTELLKERTLGVEVFDRPPMYDTNADTIVRYTAGEVRKRLLLYYSEHRAVSGVRVSLPTGSYVPEFLPGQEAEQNSPSIVISPPVSDAPDKVSDGVNGIEHLSEPANGAVVLSPISAEPASHELSRARKRLWLWVTLAALVCAISIAVFGLRFRAPSPQNMVDAFWDPVLRDQRAVVMCTGGVVFQQNNFSGVITADKDNEYPFVSMQIASAISQVSALTQRYGDTVQLISSPTAQLSDLREHPVVLLGGYNNRWAMRLLQSQPIQFTPEPVESILDHGKPGVQWMRDHSRPYSSADDYALIARFRDAATGGWVVVLAGLGRNGTEAAAQFATSPRYMQMLRGQIGQDFAARNIAAVLKVQVVDGKTGAPSIEAAHAW
jgi:hypothetical protein